MSEQALAEKRQDAWQSMGRKLLGARKRAGLEVAELASQSLVHTRFINAFEAGRDAGLAQTYAKGYLRLLVKELDLSESEILGLYESGCEGNIPGNELCTDNVRKSHSGATQPRQRLIKTAVAHTGQVFAEALGALISLGSAVASLMPKKSGKQPSAKSRGATSTGIDQTGKAPVQSMSADMSSQKATGSKRPTAILKNGSSWTTSAWSPVSWFGLVNSVVMSAVVIGVIVTASMQMDQTANTQDPSAAEIEDLAPLGELASNAVGVDVAAPMGNTKTEFSPLNGDERRAALAMLDQVDSEAKPVEPEQIEQVQFSQPSDSGAESLAAIETLSETATDQDDHRAVRSVINIGSRDAFGSQASSNAQSVELVDTFEPVGPGAEYMIAQHIAQDRLVISVYEDSWVDVRDAEGVRLYRALAKAGRRIDLSGKSPFSLHVGNAPGLGLELNGEFIPIERYRSDNSARLTLAGNSTVNTVSP